jgi:hypothetical protein
MLRDHLITAIVHFEIVADDAETAEAMAAETLDRELEDSDLFGKARVGTVIAGSPVGSGHEFNVSAVVVFRQIGEAGRDGEDALGIARGRLEQEIAQSGLLSSGAVVFADQAEHD